MARYTKAAQRQVDLLKQLDREYAKLNKALDASLKASAPTPAKAEKQPSRSRSFELDVAGSTCLREGHYNARSKTLALTFVKSGSQYLYFDVPRSVARQVESGEDFNDLIRDQFDYA
ncbi:MAG TPA: KTSC domain-containing protein [Xanthobacteraceae bacterium]|nr:KTSC domain-containing protein [Xanthobacteraceae bacterium]